MDAEDQEFLRQHNEKMEKMEKDYKTVIEWLSIVEPLDIINAIALAEGFKGGEDELGSLHGESGFVADVLEGSINDFIEAVRKAINEDQNEE